MNRSLFTILILLSFQSFAQSVDSFRVYFPLDVRDVSLTERHKIDSLVSGNYILKTEKLAIIGYADYLASNEYNIKLSQDRADNVKAYLVSWGFKPDMIKSCVGKGKVDRQPVNGKLGYPGDRKVVITLDKPELKPPSPIKHINTKQKAIDIVVDTVNKKRIEELQVNETLVLNNIYFQPGRHFIRDVSDSALEQLYNTLRDNPNLSIRIEGHICCSSEGHSDGFDYDDHTWDLSLKRAKAIYNYLVKKGIDKSRLEYTGFAKKHPLVDPEITLEDQDRNRRVEIRILKK